MRRVKKNSRKKLDKQLRKVTGFIQHHFSRESGAGFTLLEVLLYIGIFAVVATMGVSILTGTLKVQNKDNVAGEVSSQSDFILEQIKRLVRNSSLIELSANAPTSTLRLRMRAPSQDPTLVFASGTFVFSQEGAGAATALNSNAVTVDSLIFTKLANPPGKDVVQIDLSLSYASSSNPQLAISKTYRTAISRVQAAVFDSSIYPGADNTYDVGTSPSSRWKNGNFSGNVNAGGSLTVNTNTLFVDNVTGRVGIGTAGPAAQLSVASTNKGVRVNSWLDLTSSVCGLGSVGTNLYLNQPDNAWKWANTHASLGGTAIQFDDCTGAAASKILFLRAIGPSTADAAATVLESMRIDNNGNVGIGTISPGQRLTVASSSGISIDTTGGKIVNLAIPTAPSDAANKSYVDSVVASGNVDVQTFTTSGTWTKPGGVSVIYVEAVGGGGGGGGGANFILGDETIGAGGGGGGAFASHTFKASDLGSTEAVSVGLGGAGGIVTTNPGGSGSAGGTSSFDKLKAYGGGGGGGGWGGVSGPLTSAGGGGGGTAGAGNNGSSGISQTGGGLPNTGTGNGIGGGGGGYSNEVGRPAEYGGGAGGGQGGGTSIYGAGGGGGGGGITFTTGFPGGAVGQYNVSGGGGGAGGSNGVAGTAGANGNSRKNGTGGGGGGNSAAGGAGGALGGGGGGGGTGYNVSTGGGGAGGAGGRGEVRVYAW